MDNGYTGCPNKHGYSVKNSKSSSLRISNVIPDFKSHNTSMSARVYFVKTVNGCKGVYSDSAKMNSKDGQVYSVCIL